MKVHFIIDMPGIPPSSRAAWKAVDQAEAALAPVLDAAGYLRWWIEVEGGETRHMPEGDDDARLPMQDWLDDRCPPAKRNGGIE